MSSSSVVRLAGTEDLAEVLALERGIAEAPHWGETAYREYVTATGLLLGRKALFVATDYGRVRGFAAAAAVAGEAELESIAVAANAQRCGTGSQLLAEVKAWAQTQEAHRLMLEVRSSNTRAQAFYTAQGFVREGLRRRYYTAPVEDAVLMRLDLL